MQTRSDMDITEEAVRRFYVELGTRIRAARRRKRISQLELGEMVGLNRSSIANIEAGRQRSLIHLVVVIAQSLAVSTGELLPSVEEIADLGDIEIPDDALEGQPEDTQDFFAATMRRATGG